MAVSTFEYRIIDADETALRPLAADGWRVSHVIPPAIANNRSNLAVPSRARLLLERPVAGTDQVDKDAVVAAIAEIAAHGGRIPGL
jgi:hypothetical protein